MNFSSHPFTDCSEWTTLHRIWSPNSVPASELPCHRWWCNSLCHSVWGRKQCSCSRSRFCPPSHVARIPAISHKCCVPTISRCSAIWCTTTSSSWWVYIPAWVWTWLSTRQLSSKWWPHILLEFYNIRLCDRCVLTYKEGNGAIWVDGKIWIKTKARGSFESLTEMCTGWTCMLFVVFRCVWYMWYFWKNICHENDRLGDHLNNSRCKFMLRWKNGCINTKRMTAVTFLEAKGTCKLIIHSGLQNNIPTYFTKDLLILVPVTRN